jgi:hypothetical protein
MISLQRSAATRRSLSPSSGPVTVSSVLNAILFAPVALLRRPPIAWTSSLGTKRQSSLRQINIRTVCDAPTLILIKARCRKANSFVDRIV